MHEHPANPRHRRCRHRRAVETRHLYLLACNLSLTCNPMLPATGGGNVLNVQRTIKQFIAAGAKGCTLEDQKWPKKSGSVRGKEVIGMDEHIAKVLQSRRHPCWVIWNSCKHTGKMSGLPGHFAEWWFCRLLLQGKQSVMLTSSS